MLQSLSPLNVMRKSSSFSSELEMVEKLATTIRAGGADWLRRMALREFDYSSGRTDLLCLDAGDRIVAFEAKLRDWRRAIHQAWRNTSFAEKVYVVLPPESAERALEHIDEFCEAGVGLCVFDDNALIVHADSKLHQPLLRWLHTKAQGALAIDDGDNSRRAVGAKNLRAARI